MTADPATPEGVGCRSLVRAVGVLLAFAAVMVAIGLGLLLGDDPGPTAELVGFTAYAAGAPVSGLFAALAGGLPVTLYLDVLIWMLAGAGIVRLADRGRSMSRLLAMSMGIALVYGLGISSLVELA